MADTPSNQTMRTTMAVIAVVAWCALLLQLFLMVRNADQGAELRAVVNYFSFFTILISLLVAVGTSFPILASRSAAGRFFLRPSTQSAIAVYIAVVGITYTLLLRHLWNPQGAQKIADVLLHDVVPILYVAFWAIFVPKAALRLATRSGGSRIPSSTWCTRWRMGWSPTGGPTTSSLCQRELSGFPHAMGNAAGMLVAFFGLGLLFVVLGRWTGRWTHRRMAQSSPDSAASKQ